MPPLWEKARAFMGAVCVVRVCRSIVGRVVVVRILSTRGGRLRRLEGLVNNVPSIKSTD